MVKENMNHGMLDEVDIVMMANEECDPMIDGEDCDVELSDEEEAEVDNQVSDVMYDDIRDDSATIEDIAANEFIEARDSGFETELDNDVVDIVYDEEEDGCIEEEDDYDDDYEEEYDE